MKVIHLVSLLALFLVGCATPISQDDIDRLAITYYNAHICTEAGMLDQETAAKWMAIVSSNINAADTPRFKESGRRYEATGVRADAKGCSNLRLQILTALASKELKPAPAAVATQPTHTNCSTYFGQTYCTTY